LDNNSYNKVHNSIHFTLQEIIHFTKLPVMSINDHQTKIKVEGQTDKKNKVVTGRWIDTSDCITFLADVVGKQSETA